MTAHGIQGLGTRDHCGQGTEAGLSLSLTCQGYLDLCILCIDYPKDSPMLWP